MKVYEIPPERKPIRINIKVKVEDLSKDTLLEALKITVDNIRITEDNIENFTDFRINETNIASIQINKEKHTAAPSLPIITQKKDTVMQNLRSLPFQKLQKLLLIM